MKIPSGNAGQRKDLISKVESLHPYTHRTQRVVCTDNPSDGKTQETLGSPMLAKCQANGPSQTKGRRCLGMTHRGCSLTFTPSHTCAHSHTNAHFTHGVLNLKNKIGEAREILQGVKHLLCKSKGYS